MERERIVEIEYPDGTQHNVTIGRIKRKHRRELNLLVLPKQVPRNDIENVMLDTAGAETYKDRLVSFAIKSTPLPPLDELDDAEFEKLVVAAQEVNAELQKSRDQTEKKSEPPSSAAL